MTLTQMEYALAVEKHLNFQRAADACHVAQPSLSAQIKKLEDLLGAVIFQRSTNSGVVVTDVGQMVLDQMRNILFETQKIKDLCLDYKNEVNGVLRVGIIPTIGPFLLPVFLGRLKKIHPNLHLEVMEDSTRVLMDELNQGLIDVAILSPPAKAPAHIIEKFLYYEPFMVYGRVGHPLLKTKEVKMSTLSEHAVTLLDETHCMRDQVVAACSHSKKATGAVSLKQGSLQTLVSLVESEDSFTLIPKLAESVLHLAYRKLGLRPIVSQTPYRKVSLIFNRNLVRKKLIEALHLVIQESLPNTVATHLNSREVLFEPSREHFKK